MRKIDQDKFDEKKREILRAASRCFVREGFRGATISLICAEAGISPGHLYHYFDSKEAIVEGMAVEALAIARKRFDEMLGESADPLAAAVSEIERASARAQNWTKDMTFDFLAEARRNPAIAHIMREHSRGMSSLVRDLIASAQSAGKIDPGLDPDTAAAIMISMMDLARLWAIRFPQLDRAAKGRLTKAIMDALLAASIVVHPDD
jgi:TetR/AcrR family transcriptional regulator, repressor for uid operon